MAYQGSAQSIGIGLAIFLDDHFSKTAQAVTTVMDSLGGKAKQMQADLDNIQNVGVGLEAAGRGILKVAGAGLEAYASYEDIMNSVRVIGQIPADIAKQQMAELDALNMGLSKKFGILPDAIATAQLELAKAGKKGKEIMNLTEAVVALGAATDTQVDGVNGAAEMLVNIMQAFGASSKEANRYAAVMTSAANQSTIDVKDFFQSMKYAGDVASLMKIPIEEASAVIATLGNAGLKGSVAGTTYANMIRYLSTALSDFRTQKQDKAFKAMGLSVKDLLDEKGNIKSMTEVLKVFREAVVSLNNKEAFDNLAAVFGVRGNRAMPLIKSLVDGMEGQYAYEDNLAKIIADRDNNVHLQQAIDRLDDLKGDWEKFQMAWRAILINMGASIAPYARNILQRVTSVMNKASEVLENPWVQKLFALISASGVFMVIGGKILQGVAMFGKFLINFNSNFIRGITLFKSITTLHSVALKEAGVNFMTAAKMMYNAATRNMAAAQGARVRNAVPGGPDWYAQGRDKGKFQKGTPLGWVGKGIVALFGNRGIAWVNKLSAWFTKIGTKLPWLFNTITFLGKSMGWIGKILGKLVGGLFSWWFIIGDMAVTLLTGKGVLEWAWDAITGMVGEWDKVTAIFKKVGDWLANILSLGIYGLINGEGWGGGMAKDIKEWWREGTNPEVNPNNTDEDKEWWRNINTPKPKPGTEVENPLMFDGGRLVEPTASIVKPSQLSASQTVSSNNQTIIEKQKHTLNLTVNAPANGSYSKQINLEDDRALLGSAAV